MVFVGLFPSLGLHGVLCLLPNKWVLGQGRVGAQEKQRSSIPPFIHPPTSPCVTALQDTSCVGLEVTENEDAYYFFSAIALCVLRWTVRISTTCNQQKCSSCSVRLQLLLRLLPSTGQLVSASCAESPLICMFFQLGCVCILRWPDCHETVGQTQSDDAMK